MSQNCHFFKKTRIFSFSIIKFTTTISVFTTKQVVKPGTIIYKTP